MASLESIFNHLVLPPKLPGHQDTDPEAIGESILNYLIRASKTLEKLTDGEYAETWTSVGHSLRACASVNGGRLEKSSLQQAFSDIQETDLLALYVVEQNAGLLVRNGVDSDGVKTVIFEAFEASPSAEAVLASENALLWDFPGCAVEVPIEEFLRESFLRNLTDFLEKASMESLPRFAAHSTKKGISVAESRDTTSPALITDMLFSLLEEVGSFSDVTRIRKRVRDDVSIQNAEIPWRRLPLWLILRVAIQRQLCLALGSEIGRVCYKFLICTMLAEFLDECSRELDPELTVMLKAKLCRRLAKLEVEKARSDNTAFTVCRRLFSSVGLFLKSLITTATHRVESTWARFKERTTRPIPRLPSRASESAIFLSLPNSGRYLDGLLALSHQPQARSFPTFHPREDTAVARMNDFADKVFQLARLDRDIETERSPAPESIALCRARCLKLAQSIADCFALVGKLYDHNPEQISVFILGLIEQWVRMDKCAIKACPLLGHYHPVFRPEILDVLHCPTLASMQRLHDIQDYIRNRCANCRYAKKTIFSDPSEDCFAMRYLEEEESIQLCQLRERILNASKISRHRKALEWASSRVKYDNLSSKISSGTCVCTRNIDGSRNVSGCEKCWHWRSRKKIKISVHEDFLPRSIPHRAAVIFELGIPKHLAAYRNATWMIFRELAHPSVPNMEKPVMLLKDYSQLQCFMGPTVDGISLASLKKSFLQTHYNALPITVSETEVLCPNGLNFSYYDLKSGIWLNDLDKAMTFQHLCGLHVPRSLRASVLPTSEHPAPLFHGPSSYEISANETRCPSKVSIHEWNSIQRLLSGTSRRWLTMLTELASSNINFSTEETMHLISQLAVQAGPAESEELLRVIHVVFRDHHFCQRIAEQISVRLRNITSNWRETHCMEILITLSLRLWELSSSQGRKLARNLLETARRASLQWISRLRDEVRKATEADAADRAATYGFGAALLCRRTFAHYVDSDLTMNAENLHILIQASVALQQNLVIGITKLPQHLKNMLVRDMKMAYQIQSLVQSSIQSYPDVLGDAINCTWSDSGNCTGRTYSPWKLLTFPHWFESRVTSRVNQNVSTQRVNYNYVEGHLLLDGKPLGGLPREIREAEHVTELLENQHLLTFPSPLCGMTHVLASRIYGHEIHFGMREGSVVVQAVTRNGLLEYVPRSVFMTNESYDLPSGLVDNCIHWLNISSKQLEIRRKPFIWKSKLNDWSLDVTRRRAQRKNKSLLVDPNSNICRLVAGIFVHFDDPRRMTVFQPISKIGKLSVELRHLELAFVVNRGGLLYCRELRAEIDPNQDAGTFYGLESKIVLRDHLNPERRSMITSLGTISYRRHGVHVAVRASNTDKYGRFEIDHVLGRLTCAPVPLLLYCKAQFHAFTSFILPDPLTQRTGSEEALYTLRSGQCQPWTPIGDGPTSVLETIKNLSPERDYYPKDRRRLQTVSWDQHLTMTIQRDKYEGVVLEILAKSTRLDAFSSNTEGTFNIKLPSQLRRRGEIRHMRFERDIELKEPLNENQVVYQSRDGGRSPEADAVYQTVKLCRRRPFKCHMKNYLSAILQKWKLIGGFIDESAILPLGALVDGDLSAQFGSIVNFCRHAKDSHDISFRLGVISFSTNIDMDLITWLVAFGCVEELRHLEPPSSPSFSDFRFRSSPSRKFIETIIETTYSILGRTRGGKEQRQLAAKEHRKLCEADGRDLAEILLKQWPCLEPSAEEFESTVIDVDQAIEKILPEWYRLYWNNELSNYAASAQDILSRYKGKEERSALRASNTKPSFYVSNDMPVIPSLSDLLAKSGSFHDQKLSTYQALPYSAGRSSQNRKGIHHSTKCSREATELGSILEGFTTSPNVLRQQYGNDLMNSLAILKTWNFQAGDQSMPPGEDIVRENINKTRTMLSDWFDRIHSSLSAGDGRFEWLRLSDLWPSTTPITILESLRSRSHHQFGKYIKENLVTYSILITKLQRLLRMSHAHTRCNTDRHKLVEEWQNAGHENWDPMEFPDWLLLEIDGNMLIRAEQVDVAHAIISPTSGRNSVLQMNMGKGKTSCILPMVCAVLADRRQLSRLIVPKALILQTAQTMQARLGGLVGREIRHVPFSRRTSTTSTMLQLYSNLHYEILHCRGVMLTVPEHLLSYKLSGLQRLGDSKLEEAGEMIKFESWLTSNSRDVLDESDFTLAVKTQLIYPNGPQMSVDNSPHRWKVAQALLSLVEDHLPKLQQRFPQSIEVVQRLPGYPIVHILQADVEQALHRHILDDIREGRAPFLRLVDPTSSINKFELQSLLTGVPFNLDLMKRVSRRFIDPPVACKNILLVRGLLFDKILLVCLKKRWGVQYGLHPDRNSLAVPFEAKGVPSEQAEFGHPDVAITLTCLAFYYSGLTLAQFSDALQHVLSSDDPASEYDRWTSFAPSLPESLSHWNVVNVDDQGQVGELWNHLRLSRTVLHHYMNHFVFPLHAKQFSVKLQASGWDLPLFSRENGISQAKTTGFSGTNDNKMLLPLPIKQDDLPSLLHTNAEVLTYLLQDRNRRYSLAARNGKCLTELELLQTLSKRNIRILIDAGAYVLEMDNRSLVKAWLGVDTKAKGAVFFGTDNRAWVQYRGGKDKVPLLATPFAEDLDECVVYLDEAHTRGTDLKFAKNARAALTLGIGQTKDHTVQAAMRLRQLGSTQSLVFFAPPEVNQSILDVCNMTNGNIINSSHVVRYLLEQTCRMNENLQGLYIAQGTDFCARVNAHWKYAEFPTKAAYREAYVEVIQHPECQTLQELYGGGREGVRTTYLDNLAFTELQNFANDLHKRRQTAIGTIHSSALEEVEQQREVESQVEEIRHLAKPTYRKALSFPGLHATLSHFVETGDLVGGDGYEQVFAALSHTGIGQKYKLCETKSRLFVSKEFMRTVTASGHGSNDDFLRPVEWILLNPKSNTALIVISEEVEQLIPIIRKESKPIVHLIVYSAPVIKDMLPFSGLGCYVFPRLPINYNIPSRLALELGIFSGRLYLNFQECASLTSYLQSGVQPDSSELRHNGSKHGIVASMSYLQLGRKSDGEEAQQSGITATFLAEWLTIRRKGQDISNTPMGYICQRRQLTESHSFFTTREREGTTKNSVASFGGFGGSKMGVSGDEDEEDEDVDDIQDFEADDEESVKDQDEELKPGFFGGVENVTRDVESLEDVD